MRWELFQEPTDQRLPSSFFKMMAFNSVFLNFFMILDQAHDAMIVFC